MKKFFSLVLALVMALSLTTVAWGANTVATVNGTEYDDLQDAIVAAAPNGTVEIVADVTVDTWVMFSQNLTIGSNQIITLDMDGLTINGNGHTLTVNSIESAGNGDWLFHNAKELNINNWNIKAPNGLDLQSGVISGVKFDTDYIGIWPGAGNVTIDECVFNTTGSAIYLEEARDNLVVTNNEFNVPASSVASFVRGDMTFTNNKVNSGYAVSIVSTTADVSGNTFNTPVEVWASNMTLSGNSFTENGKIVIEDPNVTNVDVSGNYWGGGAPSEDQIPAAIADAVTVDSYATSVDADGTVGGLATTSDPVGAAVKFYEADNSTTGWALLHTFAGADLDDFAKDSSDNCLPCYLVGGTYYVEVNAAAGSYKLVYGAKTVYLTAVPSTAVCYSAKASVLNVVDADDAECGDWNVVALDEDDVYYATYDKKTGAVTGVYVAEKNGSVQLLVNGKIVDTEDASSDVDWMLHTWKGYDVVNYQYTTVKCSECGKVAKLYANAAAATVGKKEPVKIDNLGWITAADFFGFGAASAPSTDKTVQSADTFDAGIAMYVGMSVMAAAGSAVVIGKKKD